MQYTVNKVRRLTVAEVEKYGIHCGKCREPAVYCHMLQTTGKMTAPGFYYYCETCLPDCCEKNGENPVGLKRRMKMPALRYFIRIGEHKGIITPQAFPGLQMGFTIDNRGKAHFDSEKLVSKPEKKEVEQLMRMGK